MRWRVDFENGYASFSEEDMQKAFDMYNDPAWNAIRIRRCENIFDDCFVLEGMLLYEDLTDKFLEIEKRNSRC